MCEATLGLRGIAPVESAERSGWFFLDILRVVERPSAMHTVVFKTFVRPFVAFALWYMTKHYSALDPDTRPRIQYSGPAAPCVSSHASF
jgi:hypothetical protein